MSLNSLKILIYFLTTINGIIAIINSPVTADTAAPETPKIGTKTKDTPNEIITEMKTEIVSPVGLLIATRNWFPIIDDQPIKINSKTSIDKIRSIPSKFDPKYIDEKG